jgi:glutamate synthase (NADPH) large chain
MMMMIPEAWESAITLMDENRRAFYEYHAPMMEPWDGPAAVAFTDGRQIGATLDRNGLRPARYLVTDDDLVLMASEMGVLRFPEEKIVKKWRLQPGKMFLIDLEQAASSTTRGQGTPCRMPSPTRVDRRSRIFLDDLPRPRPDRRPRPPLARSCSRPSATRQEDIKFILTPMARNGEEATGSMGNDAPCRCCRARTSRSTTTSSSCSPR